MAIAMHLFKNSKIAEDFNSSSNCTTLSISSNKIVYSSLCVIAIPLLNDKIDSMCEQMYAESSIFDLLNKTSYSYKLTVVVVAVPRKTAKIVPSAYLWSLPLC